MKGERAGPNQVRDRLYALIGERPGISPSEIIESTGFNEGTVRYHLDLMEKEGSLVSSRSGKKRAYFLRDLRKRNRDDVRTKGSLNQKRVLSIIRSRPGATKSDLLGMVTVTGPGLSHILKVLRDKGLVTEGISDGEAHYTAASESKVLDEMLLELIDQYLDGRMPEDRFIRLKEEVKRRRAALK